MGCSFVGVSGADLGPAGLLGGWLVGFGVRG